MVQLDAWAGLEKWALPGKDRDPSLPQEVLCQGRMTMAKEGPLGQAYRRMNGKGVI